MAGRGFMASVPEVAQEGVKKIQAFMYMYYIYMCVYTYVYLYLSIYIYVYICIHI